MALVRLPLEAIRCPTNDTIKDPDFLDLVLVRAQRLRLNLELPAELGVEPGQILLGAFRHKVVPVHRHSDPPCSMEE